MVHVRCCCEAFCRFRGWPNVQSSRTIAAMSLCSARVLFYRPGCFLFVFHFVLVALLVVVVVGFVFFSLPVLSFAFACVLVVFAVCFAYAP